MRSDRTIHWLRCLQTARMASRWKNIRAGGDTCLKKKNKRSTATGQSADLREGGTMVKFNPIHHFIALEEQQELDVFGEKK